VVRARTVRKSGADAFVTRGQRGACTTGPKRAWPGGNRYRGRAAQVAGPGRAAAARGHWGRPYLRVRPFQTRAVPGCWPRLAMASLAGCRPGTAPARLAAGGNAGSSGPAGKYPASQPASRPRPAGRSARRSVAAGVDAAVGSLEIGERVMGGRGAGQDPAVLAGAGGRRVRPAGVACRRLGLMVGQPQLYDLRDLQLPQLLEPVTPPREILDRAAGRRSDTRVARSADIMIVLRAFRSRAAAGGCGSHDRLALPGPHRLIHPVPAAGRPGQPASVTRSNPPGTQSRCAARGARMKTTSQLAGEATCSYAAGCRCQPGGGRSSVRSSSGRTCTPPRLPARGPGQRLAPACGPQHKENP